MKAVYIETSIFGYLHRTAIERPVGIGSPADYGAVVATTTVIGLNSLFLPWLKRKPAKAIPRRRNVACRRWPAFRDWP